jgi:hypothetical protein
LGAARDLNGRADAGLRPRGHPSGQNGRPARPFGS